MTLAEAADQWLKARAAEKKAAAEKTEAAEVLLDHFRKTSKTSYAGKVAYSVTSSRALDTALARKALGPKKTAECEVVRTRETLTPL